jgi:hypothetical protein
VGMSASDLVGPECLLRQDRDSDAARSKRVQVKSRCYSRESHTTNRVCRETKTSNHTGVFMKDDRLQKVTTPCTEPRTHPVPRLHMMPIAKVYWTGV